jgi:hypothetical protein
MATREPATAIRATAVSKRTIWGSKRRAFRYDALFADGRIAHDVNADTALEGRRFPADAWSTRHAAEATCPEIGAGRWVEYATGKVLDDPLES